MNMILRIFVLVVCAGLPAQLLAQEVIRAAEVPALTEGPTVDAEGNLYFTELRAERIYRLSIEGELTVFREQSYRANGLVIDQQGRLIACEGGDATVPPRVTRTDLRTGEITVIADAYQGQRFSGTNDVTIDNSGRIYFTDPGAGRVYRIDPNGQIALVLSNPDINRPNGLQIAPDDRTLYIIESGAAPDGDRSIRAFDLAADGRASNGRIIFSFAGRSGDGMSVDVEGNLYISAGLNELAPPGALEAARVWPEAARLTPAGVYVISPQGELLKIIPIDEDVMTNNAFGGPDMKTLYITSGRTVFKVQNDIAGLPR